MKINIVEEKENKVMKRKEIVADLDYEKRATPSKAELQLAFSKQLSVPQDKVEISKVISETGTPKGRAWVKVWSEKTVELYGKKREEPKKEEKPPESSKEEPKKEEVKEEKK